MVPPVRRARSESETDGSVSVDWILAGRAWVRGRLQPVDIGVGADGRIASIGRVRSGAPRHDVGDGVILPAATDLHVHLRDPGGSPDVETIATGTVAAAVGGVGLVGEMPNTTPPVTDVDRLADKVARVRGRAAVDVLLFAAASDPRHFASLARVAGGFKLYLSPTTGIDDPPALTAVPELLNRLAPLGAPVAVHAEDPRRFDGPGAPATPVDWDSHRPSAAEESAVAHLLPPPPQLRLHVAHVTTNAVAQRLRSTSVSFEATPHHLLLSDRSGRDARFKVNPPLRTEAERAALWSAFQRGEIPCVASDHAPHALAEKSLPFDRAPSGVPGVETMLPLLLARVRANDLSLATVLAAACDRPARWFGQPHGRLAVGDRANLIVVDFRARAPILGRRLHSPCAWTPFEGVDAIFPREHYRDGVRIVEDGEYMGDPVGRVVRPDYLAAPTLSSAPAGRR
jgi:dihydroorotase